MNNSFANSDVNARVRSVGVEPTIYGRNGETMDGPHPPVSYNHG